MAAQWSKIRAEWLKGGITHAELAKKYGLSVKTVQNHAYKEGWKNEKGKIREKVEEKTRERVVRARVSHLEKLIQANEALLDGMVQLAEQVKENPKILTDKTGSIRNVESFARALQAATMTQRDLYGLKNIDQKFAQKKWRDQLKLEQAKVKDGPQIDQEIWEIKAPEGVELDG